MASGSLVWGALAQRTSIATALQIAAAGAVIAALLVKRARIAGTEQLDLAPGGHWPAPAQADHLEHDRGPVLVTVEYRVAAEARVMFLQLMTQLGNARRRDGAVVWGIALADRFLARHAARNLRHCGGPSGRVGRQGDA